MPAVDLLATLDSLPHPRVLVLGDLMLDRYTYGSAERISQEAPVIVLEAGSSECRLGGAASCAQMARGLEAEVSVVGVVGRDTAAEDVQQLFAVAGIEFGGVVTDDSRPTTTKERFVGKAGSRHPSQILRVDRESREPLSDSLAAELLREVTERLPSHDALIISDYGKGVCTPQLLQGVISAARALNIPVLIDPARNVDCRRYAGATLLKPNRVETELATGCRIESSEAALAAAQKLCQDFGAAMAVVTLDRDGMALVLANQPGRVFPSRARGVYDITGAGDMVMAMLGVCLAAGVSPEEAVELANIAGGLEVEKAGVAVVSREEIRHELLAMRPQPIQKVLSLAQATALANQRRREGARVVFTNGCFDLLHVGHVTYLAEAASLGDMLIVGVNSDQSVRNLKGPQRPVIREQDRAAMLGALACVGAVVIFDDPTPCRLLEALRPDVLVKGGTYAPDEVVGREIVQSYGGKIAVTSLIDGVSTTRIIASLASDEPSALRKAG